MLGAAGDSGPALGLRWLDWHRAASAPFWRRPSATHAVEGKQHGLEIALSVLAVVVAALGWFIADRLYRQRPERPQQLAAAFSPAYKLLVHKYYVDEIYGFAVVKPLMAFPSSFWSGSSTSRFWAVWHGCWAAVATLAARFCSGGSRAICAPTRDGWLSERRRCCCLCWFPGPWCWPALEFTLGWWGTKRWHSTTRFSP